MTTVPSSLIAPHGESQSGRIMPVNATPADGSYVFCIGSDEGLSVAAYSAFVRGINGLYPTTFSGSETLQFYIDAGSLQTIVFQATDQTLDLVVDRINAGITGGAASAEDDELRIDSSTHGVNSSVQISGGTGLVTLGLRAGTWVGYGGLKIGDAVRSSQDIDLSSVTQITIALKFRNPVNSELDYEFSISAAGQTLYSARPTQGDTEDYQTRTINVSHLTGPQTVTFGVEVVP